MRIPIRVLFCALLAATLSLQAETKQWTGAVDNRWSVPGNWRDGVFPLDGDDLLFGGGANLAMVNDLGGLELRSITMSGAPAYSVTGFPVTLSANFIAFSNVTWDLDTTLQADIRFDGNGLTMAGDLALNGHDLRVEGSSTFTGAITGTGDISARSLTIGGTATFNGTLTAESLHVTGTIAGPAVAVTNQLSGSGTLPDATVTGGALLPDHVRNEDSAARLTTGSLTLNGTTFVANLFGPAAATQYDQVAVNGTLSLGNAPLSLELAYKPAAGDAFVLFANDGTDAVSGTFANLPEGARIKTANAILAVSYRGGDGNDVVLTATAVPKRWQGGDGNLWSRPANWAGGQPPVDGDWLVFPEAGTFVSDLTGLDLVRVELNVLGISITGNAVTLSDGLSGTGIRNVPATLTASQTFHGFRDLELAGTIDLGGHTLTIMSPKISGSLTGTGTVNVTVPGQGALLSGTSTVNGTIHVRSSASLHVTGSVTGPIVVEPHSSRLSGTGTVGPITVASGAAITPGHETFGLTATLRTGSVTLHGALAVDRVGAAIDRLDVTGTVTLNNAGLVLHTFDPAPTPGQTFTILSNDGTDPVNGTFAGIPEGSTAYKSGFFRVTYAGGDGNDIVLTAVVGTTTALTASGTTVTATVTADAGTPAGAVRFMEGPTTLMQVPLGPNGTAVATLQLSPGTHVITAVYEGEGNFGGSTSPPVTIEAPAVATIPSLQTYGLIFMAMLLAGAGVLAMRAA